MHVWRDALAGIGLTVIILTMVIYTGNYLNDIRHTEVTATKKIYHENSDSTTMEFKNKQGDIIYSIDDYICPIGTEATIYYDKDTSKVLKIITRTIIK